MSYFFHPAAQAEHLESIAYYESKRPGLGAMYLAEFETIMAFVCKNPHRHHSKVDLCTGMSLLGGQTEPAHGLSIVFRNTHAFGELPETPEIFTVDAVWSFTEPVSPSVSYGSAAHHTRYYHSPIIRKNLAFSS